MVVQQLSDEGFFNNNPEHKTYDALHGKGAAMKSGNLPSLDAFFRVRISASIM